MDCVENKVNNKDLLFLFIEIGNGFNWVYSFI